MLGELMGGLPAAGEPDLETQWSQALKRPDIQAGLLNFGIELMKPRWSGSSALPDALSAGSRGYAGVQEEQHNRQIAEQTRQDKIAKEGADNDTRLEAARIGADSRTEVQGMRNVAMLEGIRSRETFKRELMGELTPAEEKLRLAYLTHYTNLYKADITKLGQPINEAEVVRKADETARALVLSQRVRNAPIGGQGGPIAGPDTSVNMPSKGGPVGQGGAAPAGKNTSTNTSTTATKPTALQAIERLKAIGRPVTKQVIEQLRPHVLDPAALDYFAKQP